MDDLGQGSNITALAESAYYLDLSYDQHTVAYWGWFTFMVRVVTCTDKH